MLRLNRTMFNVIGWDYQEVDAEHFLPVDQFTDGDTLAEVFVDVAWKDAKHRVSFYCSPDMEGDVKAELAYEIENVVSKGFHDDLFYEQLESDNIPTLIQ